MAAFEQALLGLNVISLLAILFSLLLMKKNREFEVVEAEGSMNTMLFGTFILFLVIAIQTLFYVALNFGADVQGAVPDVNTYILYLSRIIDLALLPLFAVCFLVGVLLARDVAQKYGMKEVPEEHATGRKERSLSSEPPSVVFKTSK